MRRFVAIFIVIFGLTGCAQDLMAVGPYVFQRRGSLWHCGYKTIQLGERYRSVVAKCGEPDRSRHYENDFGLRIGSKVTYHETKMVIQTFQDEFQRPVKQISYEKCPVYLYFDRWGICVKIQEDD